MGKVMCLWRSELLLKRIQLIRQKCYDMKSPAITFMPKTFPILFIRAACQVKYENVMKPKTYISINVYNIPKMHIKYILPYCVLTVTSKNIALLHVLLKF